MNPLALLPTWEARADHMDRVAEECEKRGLARSAEIARVNASTFRLLEEQGECPEVREGVGGMSQTAYGFIAPGEVWMREDHHLVVTVPYQQVARAQQPERVLREKLAEGLANRWPHEGPPGEFIEAVKTSTLIVMRGEDGAVTQYGVILK